MKLSKTSQGLRKKRPRIWCSGCSICSRISSGIGYFSFLGLEDAAERGCLTCQILKQVAILKRNDLLQGLPKHDGETGGRLYGTSYYPKSLAGITLKGSILEVTHRQADHPDWGVFSRVEFISATAVGPIPKFIKLAAPISQAGSDDAFTKIQDWISTCSRHLDCGSLNEAFLPKRVIDVLAATPDVVLVNSDGGRGQYTCLSHPWGDEVPLRTTIRNLQTHQNRIPFEKLPLTFQDAVKITRRIGVRWIWIDSLCIIQDDSLDWEKESSTMAAIYSNSYLTIAATSSERPSDGCFQQVTVPTHNQVRSPRSMNLLDGFYFRDVTSQMEQCKSIRGIQDFNQPTNSLPLLRRAWVFQERLLSPRVLHFAWCEMVWECRSGVICECTPGDVDKSVIEGAKRLYHQATSECESVLLPFSTWCQLSRAYFKCRITFAEDRLPALSGLARAFQEKNPTVGRYLAGIWSDNLLRGLLWWIDEHANWYSRLRLKKTYIERHHTAPTWSWASCISVRIWDYDLIFAFEESDDLHNTADIGRIVDIEYFRKGSNAFGATESGKLVLEAPLTAVHLGIGELPAIRKHEYLRPIGPVKFEKKTSDFERTRRNPGDRLFVDAIVTNAGVIQAGKRRDVGDDGLDSFKCQEPQRCNIGFSLDYGTPDSEGAVFCALLVKTEVRCCSAGRLWRDTSYRKGPLKEDFHPILLGLLLQQSKRYPGCYERIGFISAEVGFFPDAETKVFTMV